MASEIVEESSDYSAGMPDDPFLEDEADEGFDQSAYPFQILEIKHRESSSSSRKYQFLCLMRDDQTLSTGSKIEKWVNLEEFPKSVSTRLLARFHYCLEHLERVGKSVGFVKANLYHLEKYMQDNKIGSEDVEVALREQIEDTMDGLYHIFEVKNPQADKGQKRKRGRPRKHPTPESEQEKSNKEVLQSCRAELRDSPYFWSFLLERELLAKLKDLKAEFLGSDSLTAKEAVLQLSEIQTQLQSQAEVFLAAETPETNKPELA